MRAQATYSNSSKVLSSIFTSGDDLRLSSVWRSMTVPRKINCDIRSTRFVIKAVATIVPKRLASNGDADLHHQNAKSSTDSVSSVQSVQCSSEDSADLDESEKLRRMRISKANKGNTPWNKGRKHSPETLQRIRERTKLAMQNPKVKMKLVNLGHAQTEETKFKIGAGVRIGWQKRRARMIAQKKCFFEWQNLISEASRNGCINEDELQWDSYDIRSKQLEQEWSESFKERKSICRQKGNRRAPKSFEQKRKIAEAITAKWTDQLYRARVYSGKVKFHGIPGAERKTRRKPNSSSESKRRSPSKVKAMLAPRSNPIERMRLERSKAPIFKDPLASSKLEMIKSIRARRSAVEIDRFEVVKRARLLIAEAAKAAEALEVAAVRSSIARASLVETRKIIAEAILYINSIGEGSVPNSESEPCHSSSSPPELTNSICDQEIERKNSVSSVHENVEDEEFTLMLKNELDSIGGKSTSAQRIVVTKKWIRGRLVQVEESC